MIKLFISTWRLSDFFSLLAPFLVTTGTSDKYPGFKLPKDPQHFVLLYVLDFRWNEIYTQYNVSYNEYIYKQIQNYCNY